MAKKKRATKKTANGSKSKLNLLKKEINRIHREIVKKVKAAKKEAHALGFAKAMAFIQKEIAKRDAARAKLIAAAEEKFEKGYATKLKKKATVKIKVKKRKVAKAPRKKTTTRKRTVRRKR